MYQKIIYWTIMIFIIFGYGNSAGAMEIKNDKECSILNRVFSDNERLDRDAQGKEYKKIEKELKKLLEEMKRIEKDVEKEIRKKILPLIKREIEKLRRWLRELRPKDDVPEPVQTKNRQIHQKWIKTSKSGYKGWKTNHAYSIDSSGSLSTSAGG